ncbi:hypothetical protein GBA63_08120 [Rubrobacter tropicus]|uniref:Glucose/Sorbosone dehydrogenase domain-containing protein n=1 Tax=Rubrobacter tropicus TaxID=2653851 RepID=A0A6G8Q812_9ACTN|nr:PQQ-dependent sugar dehydrogenase [Rubrobacter tropicus]QIN82611.1 hypothetical protein GBA63_08120 [Rubrobacter tropicus]
MSEHRSAARRGVLTICALVLATALAALALSAGEAGGAGSVPQGFTQARLAAGLSDPTTMAMAPDGRIFVAQQTGQLKVIEDGKLVGRSAIDLSARIDARGERGLLGIAFDPAFRSNRWIYLYYTQRATDTMAAHNRVVRFAASGDRLIARSQKVILRLDDLGTATNHNGGAIRFGNDGKLYVAVGENATAENAQNFGNRLGKMLRINKDGTIPADNPFADRTQGENRAIWAMGLRNPYTFAVQPGSGRIFINDVGAQSWEEINVGIKGANYGWPVHEGPESDPMYNPPLYAYGHGTGKNLGCAVTGGAFYNPGTVTYPRTFVGDYFFADFCGGWIRRYDSRDKTVITFATGIDRPVDLMVGGGGSLHYLERATGSVYRISHPG